MSKDLDMDLESILSEYHATERLQEAPEEREPAPEESIPEESPLILEEETAPPEEAEAPLEELPAEEEDEEEDEEEKEWSRRKAMTRRIAMGLLSFVLSIVALALLGLSLLYLHPASGPAPAASQEKGRLSMAQRLEETPIPEATAPVETPALQPGEEAPEESPAPSPEPEKIHYVIPEDALAAPTPRQDGFHNVALTDLSEVEDVIRQAREDGLLGPDEQMAFRTDLDFFWASDVEYYYDETILTICWKEVINGDVCGLVETKIADASQFRRKLAGDAFGSPNQYYATELARNANSVVAMNADYYLFRDFGIVIYDGQLCRFNTATYTGSFKKYNCVETCYITGEGDFLFNVLGEESSPEAVEQLVKDNDVRFSLSFGPVLVRDGVVQVINWYPVGEIEKGYSRAGIGQMGKLHYLYMCATHEGSEVRWNVNQFAERFAAKGVVNAYCLDGGQTGEIVFQGRPYNHVDFGAERLVSDIIYFATALPEEVGS